jgi:hypothetical protein
VLDLQRPVVRAAVAAFDGSQVSVLFEADHATVYG